MGIGVTTDLNTPILNLKTPKIEEEIPIPRKDPLPEARDPADVREAPFQGANVAHLLAVHILAQGKP